MNTTPTPAEFLAQPSDPEDDVDESELMAYVGAFHATLESTEQDPLNSIAATLGEFLAMTKRHECEEREADELRQTLDQLDNEYGQLQDKLAQVLALIKPSTSKLANAIRAVFDPEPQIAAGSELEPQQASDAEPPADDATVEEWRAFGERRGHDFADVGEMNRSQIRTLLGIPQPAEVSA